MNKFHSVCDNCRKVFAKERDGQKLCFPCSKKEVFRLIALDANVGKISRCKWCEKEFTNLSRTDINLFCSDTCRSVGSERGAPVKSGKKTPTEIANEKWLKRDKNKEPNKGRKPMRFLSENAEKKRVFEEKGWQHYNLGRKWDKI